MTTPDKKEVEDPKGAARGPHNTDRNTGLTMPPTTAVSSATATRKHHNCPLLPEEQIMADEEEKWPAGAAANVVPKEAGKVRGDVDDDITGTVTTSLATREPGSPVQSNERIDFVPQLEPKTAKMRQLRQHRVVAAKSAPVQGDARAKKRDVIEASETVGTAAPIPKQVPPQNPNAATKTGNTSTKEGEGTSEPTSGLKEQRDRVLAMKEATRPSRIPDKKSGVGVDVRDDDNDYVCDSPWQELQERKNPRHRWSRIQAQRNRQKPVASAAAVRHLNDDHGYHAAPTQTTVNTGRGPREEDGNDQEVENESSSSYLRQEYQQHGEVTGEGLVVANAVTVPEIPSARVIGIPIRGGDDDDADEAREWVAELQRQKKNWQRFAMLLLVASVSVGMIVFFVNNSTGPTGPNTIPPSTISPSPSTAIPSGYPSLFPSTTMTPSSMSTSIPSSTSSLSEIRDCSSYSNVIRVDDSADLCGATLGENTAYVLAGNVTCNEGEDGPTLSSNACLDCGGNTITGNGANGTNQLFGIGIASSSTGVIIRNCVVEKFYNGIGIAGDAFISNVRIRENANIGMANLGGNTRIECSVVNGNPYGISTAHGGRLNVAGCLVEGNEDLGVWFASGSGVVSCSEILSIGDVGISIDPSADRVFIRDTVVADSGKTNINVVASGPSVNITNVAACFAGEHDIDCSTDYFWEDAFQFTSYEELTCDNGTIIPESLNVNCTYPCPAGSFSLELPETCPVCPNGVGPYIP